MKVIIDRFEEDAAVVELPDRTTALIPRRLIPGAREGDVLEIRIDPAARANREKKINRLMDELFEG